MKFTERILLITMLILLYACGPAFAVTAITPVVPTETVNTTGFITSDGINGNSVKNPAGDIILIFRNDTAASAAVATVTVQSATRTIPGFGSVTKSNITCTLAAGGTSCTVGPFPPQFWNDGNSNLQLSYTGDGSSNVEVLALKP